MGCWRGWGGSWALGFPPCAVACPVLNGVCVIWVTGGSCLAPFYRLDIELGTNADLLSCAAREGWRRIERPVRSSWLWVLSSEQGWVGEGGGKWQHEEGTCPAEMGPPSTPAFPSGSGGLMPSPPACGPCCWGCTWPISTCRLPRPAGWTRSSSAPCPCAAWWASRQLWPRGRQRARGGSGPEGQRSSSDCGGRTDGRTAPELCPARSRALCLASFSLPHSALPGLKPSPGPAPLLAEESGLPLPFPFHSSK